MQNNSANNESFLLEKGPDKLEGNSDAMPQIFVIWQKLFFKIIMHQGILFLILFFLFCAINIYALYRFKLTQMIRSEAKLSMFFYPQTNKTIHTIDINQAIALFQRKIVMNNISEVMNYSSDAIQNLGHYIKFAPAEDSDNMIMITAYAKSKRIAIDLVNVTAQQCIDEYHKFRAKELEKHTLNLEAMAEEIRNKITFFEKSQQKLLEDYSSSNPEQELGRIREVISQLTIHQTDIKVQLSNQEVQIERLNILTKGISQKTLFELNKIKPVLSEKEKTEKELFQLSKIYTDQNPRIIILKAEYKRQNEQINKFLEKNDIANLSPELINQVSDAFVELQIQGKVLEQLQKRNASIDKVIQENRKIMAKITEIIPQYNQYDNDRKSYISILAEKNETLADLISMKDGVKNELQPVEKTLYATEYPIFTIKGFLLAIIIAIVLSLFLTITLTIIRILEGKIQYPEEIEFYKNISYIGCYSTKLQKKVSKRQQIRQLHYQLEKTIYKNKIVLVTSLPRCKSYSDIQSALNWNAAMSGLKTFNISIVDASTFDFSTFKNEMKDLLLIQSNNDKGILPLENFKSINPAELKMFENDVQTIAKDFDIIFLQLEKTSIFNSFLFEQIQACCDCSLIFVGLKVDKRKNIYDLTKLQEKTGKTMGVLVI